MHRAPRIHGSRICLALAVVLTALAATLVAVTGTGSAAASNHLRPGRGYRVHGGDFVGYYVTPSGRKVYCLDPRKATPTSVSLSTVHHYPGRSAATTAALSYALTRWGDARSAAQAAVESQVLNVLVGNVARVKRRAAHLPKRLGAAVTSHVREARRLRGPYAVHLRAPAALPGQSATGSVRVLSGSGHLVPGVRVRLRHSSNVRLVSSLRTNSHGDGQFRYAVTDTGQVRLAAAATSLPSTAVAVSHPRAGRQRMVAAVRRTAARASASFTGRVSSFSDSYACTTTCDGRPVTTLRACAEPSRVDRRLDYRLGTRIVPVNYPAAATRRCRTATVRLRDGDRVTAAWRFRKSKGWSRPVAARGGFTVDCPPAPAVVSSMRYDCAAARVAITLVRKQADGRWVPLVNGSRHRLVLVIGGSRSARIVAERGQTAAYAVSTSCSAPLHLTMRAGVQRANGRYNYGPAGALSTPGKAA